MDTNNDQYGGKPILNNADRIGRYGVAGNSDSLDEQPLVSNLNDMTQMQLNQHIIKELKFLGRTCLVDEDLNDLRQSIRIIRGRPQQPAPGAAPGAPPTAPMDLHQLSRLWGETETRLQQHATDIADVDDKAENAVTAAAAADRKADDNHGRLDRHETVTHPQFIRHGDAALNQQIQDLVDTAVGAMNARINALMGVLGFDEGIAADGVTPTAGPVWAAAAPAPAPQGGGYKKKRKTRKKKNKRRSKRS